MCGIVGSWHRSGLYNDLVELDAFTDSLAHRGPDGRGTYLNQEVGIGLGHRRLSVIDLSEDGSQPMRGAGDIWITYNGEIYNYIEIRRELESYGHRFSSQSDTEVILAAYAQWGSDCQMRFNGMWAFAIWDEPRRRLFLSRDRFGVKPLFYMLRGTDLYFASELKAFLALRPSHRPAVNEAFIASLSDVESATETMLRGVRNLNAGHQLVLDASGDPLVERWWRTSQHLVEVPKTFEEQGEKYRDLMDQAVSLRTRSDVALGSAVSGGLDSSAIASSISKFLQSGLLGVPDYTAFTADYVGSLSSELPYAQELARGLGLPLTEIPVDPGLVSPEEIARIIFSLESFHDPALGPWRLYQGMRKDGVVVSIDGHGPDEALGGYHLYPRIAMRGALLPWHHARFNEAENVLAGMTAAEMPDGMHAPTIGRRAIAREVLASSVNKARKGIVQGGVAVLGGADGVGFQAAKRIANWALPTRRQERWSQMRPLDIGYLKKEVPPSRDPLQRRLFIDFHYDVLPSILAKFDRMSMANGVEVRSPFLDWRLVTYSLSLPSASLMRGGYSKAVLREATRGRLPDNIRLRKSKIGFASPMQSWFAGPLGEFVQDVAASQQFLDTPIWNGVAIRSDLEKWMAAGNYAQAVKVWPYVQATVLMDQFSTGSERV
mgnify:CR=1 FL=1